MIRPEIEFRKPFLQLWPGAHSLVEPALGSTPGEPDTWLAFRGFGLQLEGWLEFKVLEDGGRFHIRPQQKVWHQSILKHSSNLAFCVVDAHSFWLVPSRLALEDEPSVKHSVIRGVTWDDVRAEPSPTLLPRLVSRAFDGNEI